jgi:exodeoxyribonuclease-3
MTKITTWNVNGIRAREAQVLDWVQREQPDILCLQEIKASPEHVPAALCALEGYWCYWHGHKGYSGVGLHLSKSAFPRKPVFTHPAFDHENRIVAVQVEDLLVASIYVPNGGKDYPAKLRFLEAMIDFIEAEHARGTRLVLCGDLNVARLEIDVHPKLRKPEQIGQTPEERALFERMLSHGLVDLSRRFEPDNDQLFSWWAPWRNMRERNIGWRLDYLLVSESIAKAAKRCVVHREFGTSDHGPVMAEFDQLVKVEPLTQEERFTAEAEVPPPPPPEPKGQLTLDLGVPK